MFIVEFKSPRYTIRVVQNNNSKKFYLKHKFFYQKDFSFVKNAFNTGGNPFKVFDTDKETVEIAKLMFDFA